jgi:fibronectin type III domain protein
MSSKQQHAAKDKVLADIITGMRANLKYAEATAHKTPEKLDGLGWSARHAKTPLQVPGEVRDITMPQQGDSWVVLSWNPPGSGGLSAAYVIQRKQPTGGWEDVATAMTTEYLLSNQPKGLELSYRVVARNKAGSGQPSGVVTAVL